MPEIRVFWLYKPLGSQKARCRHVIVKCDPKKPCHGKTEDRTQINLTSIVEMYQAQNHLHERAIGSVLSVAEVKALMDRADGKLIILDATAQWCQPCAKIAPRIEQLAKEYPDVIFMKFDVEEATDLADEYNITAMPTFLFIKRGKEVARVRGADYQKLAHTLRLHADDASSVTGHIG